MRVTGVELVPSQGDPVSFSFKDYGRSDPYNIKQIVGLDATEIVARSYSGPINTFRNLLAIKRDVVLLTELNPDFGANQTYSDLRDDIYRLVSSSRSGLVQVRFLNDGVTVASVSGTISKVEASHFSSSPEVQITVKCNDSMLKAETPTEVDVVAFDLDSFIVDDQVSTAPHGFTFELTYLDIDTQFIMGDILDTTWSFTATPFGGFLAGDVLKFSSEVNNKYLILTRDAVDTHIADTIIPGSIWPILFPGENRFGINNGHLVEMDALAYYPTYWGV